MVEKYLTEEYERTRWPFFRLVDVLNKFGEPGRDELNRLAREGKVRGRNGMNGKLVELLH